MKDPEVKVPRWATRRIASLSRSSGINSSRILEDSLKLGLWTLEQRLKKVIKEHESINKLWSLTNVDESHTEGTDQESELAESEDQQVRGEDSGFTTGQGEERTTNAGSDNADLGPGFETSDSEALNLI